MGISVRGTLGGVLAALALGGWPGAASAQIPYQPCREDVHFACAHLLVPLDPAGVAPGTVTLALRRHRAPLGETRSAIIALAGGPGQAALPFAEQFAEVLGPIAASRDLIVLDQRGTGLSGPLSCHAFERSSLYRTFGSLIAACASQLGAARAFYTTEDTVADIEAIRVAGGYEKLVLYGTSYGTKVAELYAQRYPQHVEALVLDSVVPPDGPDTLDRPTFAAIPRVLRSICAQRACAGVTRDPVRDLARVLRRIARRPLVGVAYGALGQRKRVPIAAESLLSVLLAGDFTPALRAQLVTADRAAATGDAAPLARLLSVEGGEEREDFDSPLYFATTCEEQRFPWSRSSSPRQRLREAAAAARRLPASTFAPFTAATALEASDLQACAWWPNAGGEHASDTAPVPAVPTLILSGADDLRTPTEGARALAAQIPGAHLLVVPYTGHAVLGGASGSCAREALLALFVGRPIRPCPASPPPPELTPPPLPPTSLARVRPARGYRGRPGATLAGVALTLADLGRQLGLAGELGGAPSVGGLRGGWATYRAGRLVLHGYSYVPGLAITGSLGSGRAALHVGGAAAARGTLDAAGEGSLTGTLGGLHVTLPAESSRAAGIVGSDVAASRHDRARGAGARTAFGEGRHSGGREPRLHVLP